MSIHRTLAAISLATLAACGKQEAKPVPASTPQAESCTAPDGVLPPDQRAAAYVKLVSDLQTIGLEVNGIDAAGRVVFVPKGICAKPTKPSTISEAAQLLKNRDYTLASCSEPPIVISSACRTKSD